jgi:hypothetical protein
MKEIWEYLFSGWDKFLTYLSRRKDKSYTQLWEALYGDGWYEKGIYREYDFIREISAMWASEAKRLRKELEQDHLDVGDLEESAFQAGFQIACNKISKRINDEIKTQQEEKENTSDPDEKINIFLFITGLGMADRIIKWVWDEETK